jgi:hypothetical protein
MLSEFSVHDCFVSLLLGPVIRQTIMEEGMWWSEPAYFIAAKNRKRKKGVGFQHPLSGYTLSDLTSFHLSPYLLRFPPFHNSITNWGPSFQHIGPNEWDIQDPRHVNQENPHVATL